MRWDFHLVKKNSLTWLGSGCGKHTVRSNYSLVQASSNVMLYWKIIWKPMGPVKGHLCKKAKEYVDHMLLVDVVCVRKKESIDHMLLHCDVARRHWYKMGYSEDGFMSNFLLESCRVRNEIRMRWATAPFRIL